MAAANKFNQLLNDFCNAGNLNLATDAIKVGLTNTSPNAADTDLNTSLSPDRLISTSNADEIASGNGYTEGGAAVTITTASQAGGTYTLAGNQVVFTASAPGPMATFRYIYMYDNTAGAAGTRPLILWWDYGSALVLNDGDSLTIKFNNANPGTIFTIA